MDKSSLRHIHDPVLLSLKVEVISYILLLPFCLSQPKAVQFREFCEIRMYAYSVSSRREFRTLLAFL